MNYSRKWINFSIVKVHSCIFLMVFIILGVNKVIQLIYYCIYVFKLYIVIRYIDRDFFLLDLLRLTSVSKNWNYRDVVRRFCGAPTRRAAARRRRRPSWRRPPLAPRAAATPCRACRRGSPRYLQPKRWSLIKFFYESSISISGE